VARTNGLAGLSLRDVAASIGMRPPSLYWYFNSKDAIYDAMLAQGYRQLLDRLAGQAWPREPRAILRRCPRVFVEFSAEDAERYQLLFQRTIPDFEPSPASSVLAVQVFDQMQVCLAAAGLRDTVHFDMWAALVGGLSAQQTTKEPGGDRWLRLIDEMANMYADHVLGQRTSRQRQS
jgi:AcrR family transcriptional regulator